MKHNQMNVVTQMGGRLDDNSIRIVRMDAVSNTMMIMQFEHHEIHEGNHFTMAGYKDVNNAQTLALTITAPDTNKWAHMTWNFFCNGPLTMVLHEGASGISSGTPLTPVNNNRNSLNVSAVSIVQDPTVGTPGSILFQEKFGTVGPGSTQALGGNRKRVNELILKRNTSYYWLLTAGDDNLTIDYEMHWYEHVSLD